MSFQFDTLHISHQLTSGISYPKVLGLKEDVIRGSVFLESPSVIGGVGLSELPPDTRTVKKYPYSDYDVWEVVEAPLMVGPCRNEDSPIPCVCDPLLKYIPEWGIAPCGIGGVGAEKYGIELANPYSLVVRAGTHKTRNVKCVQDGYKNAGIVETPSESAAMFIGDVDIYGYTRIKDRLSVCNKADFKEDVIIGGNLAVGGSIGAGGDIKAAGEVMSQCGGHILSQKKNFDIPHPSKEGWRLTHSCIEGPEAAVYTRGRVTGSTEIDLPSYWKDLVDIQSITIQLQPIGSHQDVIIKRWDDKKVYLQSKGGMPIDCFYHIYGERKDTEKLIPEYKGTIEDYPGDNSQRSIAGYHYDVK